MGGDPGAADAALAAAEGVAEGIGGALATALGVALVTSPAALVFVLSSHAAVTAAIARPKSTTDQLDFTRFCMCNAYYSSHDVGGSGA